MRGRSNGRQMFALSRFLVHLWQMTTTMIYRGDAVLALLHKLDPMWRIVLGCSGAFCRL